MSKYLPGSIESKWQQKWQEDELYRVDLEKKADKYYMLVELPYTSGDLHTGHWFTFTYGDVLARFKRMQGFNVVYPNGFDAFGLPAENAAIRNGIHPADWTYANADRMRNQFNLMGASFDWEKTAISCDPKYYRWNQWIFLKMFERGLAYRGKALASWCPSCQTVLAEENIEAGKCWRCGTEVVKKEIEQWFFKITQYADRLIWPETPSVDYPKSLRDAQNNWIGKSQGAVIDFDGIKVFTTRADTIFGATFLVLSPEHPQISRLTKERKKEVAEYIGGALKKSEQERKESKDKTGIFTGSYVENPLSKEKIPVWIADYVLMNYGTGAIMAVPAHDQRDFEFAKKYNLLIRPVVKPVNKNIQNNEIYQDEGLLVDSGEFTGLPSSKAREKISEYLVSKQLGSYHTNYHLHDWSISRQRYWGTPIPIIYCDKCGVVPVPESDLPVELPRDVDYTPQGKPPLATAEKWLTVKCPKCGRKATREVETMDGFVDNSWYFYRYLDPNNQAEIFSKKLIEAWMPIDIYIGGSEHTYGHALYSRFFTMFFHDLGLVSFEEYTKRRLHHGVILGPDGHRMSKSRGNVVNPDEEVKQYGADAIRTYLTFLGPFDIVTPWNPDVLNGVYRFIERIWNLFDKVDLAESQPSANDLNTLSKTVLKVTNDIEAIKYNTAIASLMEWLNYLSKKEKVHKVEYKILLQLLSPFAPHLTEELWERQGEKYSIHQSRWPSVDKKHLMRENQTIIVTINGKVRDQLQLPSNEAKHQERVEKLVYESAKIKKYLAGKTPKKVIFVSNRIINLVI